MMNFCSTLMIIWICVKYGQQEVTYIAERLPLQGVRPHPGSPWPMTKEWIKSDQLYTLLPEDLKLSSNIECDIIHEAYHRFTDRLHKVTSSYDPSRDSSKLIQQPAQSIKQINVAIHDKQCPTYPQFDVDENYNLNISTVVILNAKSVWGAIWGFETLNQLIFMVNSKWYVNQSVVNDGPRFSHRGLLLDTARHFYDLDILKLNLDAMVMNKLNVFHWHIVDAQSFPYNSTMFPDLALKGSYSREQVYRQSDVADVIEYARLRGIRVVPEFDTPGHAQSWGKAFPDLLTTCYDGNKSGAAVYGNHSDIEIIDPTKNATFDFLQKFFSEIKDVFKDEFIHMGMDEVHYYCWESSPVIKQFMKDHKMTEGNFSELETYYSRRLLDIVKRMNKRVVIWEDPLNHGAQISNDTIVQVWKDTNSPPGNGPWQGQLTAAIRQGYQVILSSCWYLNFIKYGPDWKQYYLCEPYNITASQEEVENIVGGEACVWSEFIDENNLMSLLWPRLSAVAERLWSPKEVANVDEATFRLDQHRCRMLRHGIPAKPILPGYCRDDYNTDNSLIGEASRSAQRPKMSPYPFTLSSTTRNKTYNIVVLMIALVFVTLMYYINT